MCQIQFIKKLRENLNERDLQEFFKLMEFGSFDNSDAFGFFNRDVLFKNKGIFNLETFQKNKMLLSNNFLIGHNRLATSGDKNKNQNNHPFIINNFMLVHNGIINNSDELRKEFKVKSNIETDSFIIIYLINHYFKKSLKKNRIKRIIDAIKKTTKKIEGFFSVFLYDKKDNNIFYFKDDKTNFSFGLFGDNILVGTTDIRNLNRIYLNKKYIFDEDIFKEKSFKEIEDKKIYLINDDVFIKVIGKFKTNSYTYSGYGSYSRTDYQNLEDEDDINSWNAGFNYKTEDEKENEIFKEIDDNFKIALGYIPKYEFDKAEGMIYIKKNEIDKKTRDDIGYIIDEIFEDEKYIYFDLNNLMYGSF